MFKTALMLSVAATGLISPAFAKTTIAGEGAAPAAQADGGFGELVVTAQRREQSAQAVGIALTAFSGDDLADKGITQVSGLETITPSLEVEDQFGSGQPVFAIRGVGFRDYATNNSPTVGIYVDEVNFPYPVMTQGVLFDVERVEVLRGPQGTLYGRNTTGGAINVVSRRPTEEFEAGVRLSYGSYNAFSGEGYVSGALGAGFRARLSGTAEQGGAWQENRETGEELGDKDRYALRGLLEFDVTESLTVLLNLHGYKDQSDGLGLQLFQDTTGPVAGILAHTGQRSTSWGASALFSALTGISETEKPFRDNEGFGASLTANWDLNGAALTYVGAYEDLSRAEYNDYDGISLGAAGVFFESDIDVMSHEVRLASVGDKTFDWITGVFYAQENLDENYQSDFAETFGLAVFTPYEQEVQTIGVFGQAEYQVTSLVNVIAGVRYENEERDLNDLGTFSPQVGGGTFNFANGLVGVLESRSTDMSEATGKLGVEVTPTDDLLVYATISRGVKSGGFTAYNTLNPRGIDPFEPEKLIAYELGFKTDFDFGTSPMRLNGAVFFYDYEDQQVQSAIYDPGLGAVVGKIVNAPSSQIWGGELEMLWLPTEHLTVTQTLGYKRGEFDEFFDLDVAATILAGSEVLIDRSGQSLGLPAFSYSGEFAYEAPAYGFEGYNWNASFNYSYRDDVTPPLLGPVYKVESYWLANARIGFTPDSGNWEIAIWGRNLFNTEYDETRNFFDPCCSIAAPGAPLTYGLQLAMTF